ncbi:MAG: phosphodiesterase [Clostridia bacterium]|nr:phosphodiesterase [Clostridia bacterium]
MKFVIASDIHGSNKYCNGLLAAFKRENADKLLLLGDILYHGPRNPLPEDYAPAKVAEALGAVKERILCVRGNCDSEVDQMVLPFPVTADYAAVFADGVNIYLSHGHREVPPLCENDVYITGHTHVPLCESVTAGNGTYLHLNPGSVSLPKENSGRGYILFDNGTFYFKTLDGKTFKEVKV